MIEFQQLQGIMLPHQISKLSQKQKNVLVAADKKRSCDQRALHIVEMLIEPEIDQAWLLHQLHFIDQHHYSDVTEERYVTGVCGYPLCANKLGKIPNNQFQLSTNTNRIYDISERKKYCSNACFRASRYLKPQIQTSPLWLRGKETAPVFKLLNGENNRRGVAGDLVDLGVARAPADNTPQVTTDAVATDMMHQFDELSEQIRNLGLQPEEEPERAGGGRAARASCLKRPGGGRGDGDMEPATRPAKTVQFGAETVEDAASRGSLGGAGDASCRQESREGADNKPSLTPEEPARRQESREAVDNKPSLTPEEPARRQETQGEAGNVSSLALEETAHRQETPKEAGSESPPAPEETAHRQQTPKEAVSESPPAPEETPPPQKKQKSESARTAVPTSGFKRPARSARRVEHPLKVVEARLLDWMSARTAVAPSVAVGNPLRVEIPGVTAGPEGHTAGPEGHIATSGEHGGNERTAVADAGDGATTVTPNSAGHPVQREPVADLTSTTEVPADAANTPPTVTPDEAVARNQALLAYLGGQMRLPPAAPPRRDPKPAQEPQLTPEGRPVPPEPLLESQEKVRRRIVNEHLSKATARLLPPLGLVMTDVASPLRQLVARFHLTALNVTMGPNQWTLAALILLRCLLRQSAQLAALARHSELAFGTALQPFQLTLDRLDRLVNRLHAAAGSPGGPRQ